MPTTAYSVDMIRIAFGTFSIHCSGESGLVASRAPTNTSRLGKAHQLRLSRAGCPGQKGGSRKHLLWWKTGGELASRAWKCVREHTPQTKTRHWGVCVCVPMHGKDGRQTQLREKWLTQMPIEPAKAHACSRHWEQARREKGESPWMKEKTWLLVPR